MDGHHPARGYEAEYIENEEKYYEDYQYCCPCDVKKYRKRRPPSTHMIRRMKGQTPRGPTPDCEIPASNVRYPSGAGHFDGQLQLWHYQQCRGARTLGGKGGTFSPSLTFVKRRNLHLVCVLY